METTQDLKTAFNTDLIRLLGLHKKFILNPVSRGAKGNFEAMLERFIKTHGESTTEALKAEIKELKQKNFLAGMGATMALEEPHAYEENLRQIRELKKERGKKGSKAKKK